jgi:hypothetical protein
MAINELRANMGDVLIILRPILAMRQNLKEKDFRNPHSCQAEQRKSFGDVDANCQLLAADFSAADLLKKISVLFATLCL